MTVAHVHHQACPAVAEGICACWVGEIARLKMMVAVMSNRIGRLEEMVLEVALKRKDGNLF